MLPQLFEQYRGGMELLEPLGFSMPQKIKEAKKMGFGKGALLWLLGVPLPIIILLALFWHH